MQITTTFRHMEPSDALKSDAEEKLHKMFANSPTTLPEETA